MLIVSLPAGPAAVPQAPDPVLHFSGHTPGSFMCPDGRVKAGSQEINLFLSHHASYSFAALSPAPPRHYLDQTSDVHYDYATGSGR
jgi:hypothetical protein